MPIAQINDALKAFAQGEFLIVIDDPERENEGDLIISAAHLTPEKMAFMIRYTSGLICVPMSETRLLELGLPDMVERNEESLRTAYTISCDARSNITTGISASDRAHTCNLLANPKTTGNDLVRPGHIFPLRARVGGVLVRDGHTEAAVDLCQLAGLVECAAISEIVGDNTTGEMARTTELLTMGEKWGINVITIEHLKSYRKALTTEAQNHTTHQQLPEGTRLLSSILFSSCSFFLLELHIERLQRSASRLGWKKVDALEFQRALYSAVMGRAHLTLKLRAMVDSEGQISVEASEVVVQKQLLGPFTTGAGLQGSDPQISKSSMQSPSWTVYLDTEPTMTESLLPCIENKTTFREHYDVPMVRTSASLARNEEVLLYNEHDQVTEGSITNVIFKRNSRWVTPKLETGLLGGVMRRYLLDNGKIFEAVIRKADLINGEAVLLCNAVRGVLNATLVIR